MAVDFIIEIEQEVDGRWIVEVVDLPGVLAYGQTDLEAKAKVQALALRVFADRLEHGEAGQDLPVPGKGVAGRHRAAYG